MTQDFLLVTNHTIPRETTIALARRLLSEGSKVSVLAPWSPALEWLDVQFFTDIAMIEGVEDKVVLALSPDVVAPLRAVLGSKVKKLLGPEGLASQVSQSLSLSLSFFAQAGAKVSSYAFVPQGEKIPQHSHLVADRIGGSISSKYKVDDRAPLGVVAFTDRAKEGIDICLFVSGRHLLPFALQYHDIRGIMPKGGPRDREGTMLIPVWSKKLAKVSESIRLGCVASGYTGPVFLHLEECDEKIVISDVHYQYPPGFMTAFLRMLQQSAGQFFYSLMKGKYFKPNVMLSSAVALRVAGANESQHLDSPQGSSVWGGDSYHGWVGEQDTNLPDEVWSEFPEAWVKLDGFSGLTSTLDMLKCHGFSVGLKPDEPNQPQQEQVVEEALSCS